MDFLFLFLPEFEYFSYFVAKLNLKQSECILKWIFYFYFCQSLNIFHTSLQVKFKAKWMFSFNDNDNVLSLFWNVATCLL